MGSEGTGWKAIALDEVEAVPWRGTELVWHPVRSALGTRIVGMGGYTAERVGQVVIEGHTESEDGLGHEEVYVVLRGRATFTLDDTEVDAPAGTLLVVDDPGVYRSPSFNQERTTLGVLDNLDPIVDWAVPPPPASLYATQAG